MQRMRRFFPALAIAVAAAVLPCRGDTAPVDQKRLAAAGTSADWLSHGRTSSERRFSSLAQINATTVHRLGLT